MCSVREWETRPVNRKRQKSVHRPDPRLTEDRSDHLETPTQPHQSPLPPRVWRLSETGNSSITSSTFHPSHRSRSAFLVPSILFFLERGTDVSAPLRVIISRRHEYHSVPGTDGGGETRRQEPSGEAHTAKARPPALRFGNRVRTPHVRWKRTATNRQLDSRRLRLEGTTPERTRPARRTAVRATRRRPPHAPSFFS